MPRSRSRSRSRSRPRSSSHRSHRSHRSGRKSKGGGFFTPKVIFTAVFGAFMLSRLHKRKKDREQDGKD
ncbi:unnamed protein product [Zymoseptoria tritici ST99CH_3D7]|uniref:Uncharacterized protein n=1 Tax=Zymoseptoria tritici (strain ST99CH_3D7) TaxID=1276538 RepID=A0A1X7RSG1_ZYMT9|nr:unnamed protein product [Zymoseptoria tritici ST99CH_3D7]